VLSEVIHSTVKKIINGSPYKARKLQNIHLRNSNPAMTLQMPTYFHSDHSPVPQKYIVLPLSSLPNSPVPLISNTLELISYQHAPPESHHPNPLINNSYISALALREVYNHSLKPGHQERNRNMDTLHRPRSREKYVRRVCCSFSGAGVLRGGLLVFV
jgi:hypothetical protein